MSWRYSLGGCCCGGAVRDFLFTIGASGYNDPKTKIQSIDATKDASQDGHILPNWSTEPAGNLSWPAQINNANTDRRVLFFPTGAAGESGGYYTSRNFRYNNQQGFVSKFKIDTDGAISTVWTRSAAEYPYSTSGSVGYTLGWSEDSLFIPAPTSGGTRPEDATLIHSNNAGLARYWQKKEDGSGGLITTDFWVDLSTFSTRTILSEDGFQTVIGYHYNYAGIGGADVEKGQSYKVDQVHTCTPRQEQFFVDPYGTNGGGSNGYPNTYTPVVYGENLKTPTQLKITGTISIPQNASAGQTINYTVSRYWYGGVLLKSVTEAVTLTANYWTDGLSVSYSSPMIQVGWESVSLADESGDAMAFGMIGTTEAPTDPLSTDAVWTFYRIFSLGSNVIKQDTLTAKSRVDMIGLPGATYTAPNLPLAQQETWADGSSLPKHVWLLGSGRHWLVATTDDKIHLYDGAGVKKWTMQAGSPLLSQSSGDFLYLDSGAGVTYGGTTVAHAGTERGYMIDYKSATPTVEKLETILGTGQYGSTTAWGSAELKTACPLGAVPEGFRKDD